jgi:hypothetical protein
MIQSAQKILVNEGFDLGNVRLTEYYISNEY